VRYGGVLAMAAVIFVLGFAAGATVRPAFPLQSATPNDAARAATRDAEPMRSAPQNSPRFDARLP
jgi:hypothetical protein